MANNVQPRFTDNEIKSIAINPMGRSSEAGVLSVMKLGLAVRDANINNGIVNHPSDNNSGYTVGPFQWDIAAQRNGKEFVERYNNSEYIINNPDKRIPDNEVDTIAYRLQQNRKTFEADSTQMVDIRRENIGQNINAFLKTSDGREFISELQNRHYINALESELQRISNMPALHNMSDDDARIILAACAKLINQTGSVGGKADSRGLEALLNDKNTTKDIFVNKINATTGPLVREGVAATINGAILYNKINNDKGLLGDLFREYNTQDPLNIPNFKEDPINQLMDGLFRQPAKGRALIDAINYNQDYISLVSGASKAEAYTIGVKDGVLFSIDKGGNAHKMNDQGQWIAFDNNKNPLIHTNSKGDWTLTPRDLTKDHVGVDVAELQEKLNALSPNGAQITTNGKDSVYDQATVDQVKAFQEAHGLTATGQYDNATRSAIDAQLNEHNKHLPFVRTSSSQKPEQQIINKLANIQALNEKLNDPSGEKLLSEADQSFFGRDILLTSHEGDMAQLGGYLAKLGLVEENATTENILSAINQFERTNNLSQDNTNWSETLSALKDQYITHQKDEVTNEIQTERQAMAQLELDRITDINEQQTKLTTDKAELTDDIALKGAQIIALQGLQENFANNASNDNVANNPLSETAMSLLNKNTLNLNNDKTGEVTDLKQLQTVLKEEGYLKGKADGLWGNDTEQALAKATGLTQDNVKALVTTDLGQDGNGQVIDPKIMESGRLEALRSQYLESKVSQLTLSKTELENKSMGIDDKLSILDTQRPSIIEQNIVSEQLKINQLQENIRDYDKTHIEPLTELQAQLSNHINDPTPYQSVKDELSAANISLLTSEQQSLMDSSALLKQNGKTNNIDNVQSAQSFLIEKGYLDATWKDKQGVEHPSNDGNFGGGTHKAIVAYQTEKGLNADGVVGKDFRVAMKEDIYSNLSINDLNQRIEVEMAARIEGKETKIAELSSSINQSELRIGQLQSEQKTMIATQQSLQQSQESKEPVVTVEGKQNTLDTAFNLSTQRSDVSIESGAKGAVLNVGNQQCSMDFCKVKNFEHYANGNNTLLGKLNDDDQFKIFHRSGGKLNEVATIDDFSKQNLVALEESVRTQGLAQGRNQDQGREA